MRILCLTLEPWSNPASSAEPDLARLMAELEEFSPHIGRISCGDRSAIALEIGRTARWFGGEDSLTKQLRRWCRERRLACRAAIADTLGLACGLLLETAADSNPFTCRNVPPNATRAVLATLPIAGLRLSPNTLAVLIELGFRTVGPLLSLARDALAERFDPELLLRLDQALGTAPEPFASYRPEPELKAGESWEHGVASAEIVLRVWDRLLPELVTAVADRGRGVARLSAELVGESSSLRRIVVSLLRPTVDRSHLLDLLRLRLESVRMCEPVVGTRLEVLDEGPMATQQQVLFAELAPPLESAAWGLLVERLTGRLGPERVVRIRPQSDHQPERAWRAAAWIGNSARSTPNVRRPPSAVHRSSFIIHRSPTPSPLRPTLLLPRPRAVEVFAIAPQGHPQQFSDRGCDLQVVRSWGPERIETGWWRGPSLRRDYYRVQTATGREAWLFRDLRSRRWFLHGWFD